MKIYIPTLGRIDKQHTYEHLPSKLKKLVTFVVDKQEAPLHAALGRNIAVCPKRGTGNVRQWIVDQHEGAPEIVMLDDDLRFDKRREDNRNKFLVATEKDILELFAALKKSLKSYAHASVLPREGGNRLTEPFVENSRAIRVLAYRVDILRKENIKFDHRVIEDFDMTLTLLRRGYKNIVLCDWVHGQGSSNAPGGCSTYRTPEFQTAWAERLHRKHPEFVKLVTKQTKVAWNGKERTDVVIQWKKAYESSGR